MSAKTQPASRFVLLVACGLALGCYWAWNGFLLSEGSQTVQRTCNTIAHGLTLLVFFLATPSIKLSKHRWLLIVVPLIMAIASGLFVIHDGLSVTVQYALSIVLGCSSAVLFVLWVEAFARFTLIWEIENITYFAVVLSLVLPLLHLLSDSVNVVAVVALPLVSCGCIAFLLREPPASFVEVRGRRTAQEWPTVIPPWLMVCALAIATPLGYFKAGFTGSWYLMTFLSIVIGAVGVALAILLRRLHKSEHLPRTLILVISAGLLIMPLYDEHLVVAGALVYAGSALFRTYIYQTCALVCLKSNTSAVKAFTLATCIIDLGWVLGLGGRWLLEFVPPVVYTYTTVGIVYSLVVVVVVLFSRQRDPLDAPATPEHRKANRNEEADDAASSPLVKASELLAARYSLTEREREIAVLVVEGQTFSSIADGMTVSRNTVKTHVHHAYRKCGVHSREELSELLRSYLTAK